MDHPRIAVYVSSDLTADAGRMDVRLQGRRLDLEPKALRVLFHLIENHDRVVTKEELFGAAWAGTCVTDNALSRVIAQLRKQLGDDARCPRYIETVAAVGYRYVADVRVDNGPPVMPEAPAGPMHLRWRWAVAVTAAIAILAIVGWLGLRPHEPLGRLVAMRQITTSAALDKWPAFSPDGSQIAFSSNRTGHFEIYVRSLASGGSERQITFDGQDNTQPRWSPDGRMLAYSTRMRIALIPVSGGPTRYVFDSGDDPQWSPDGRMLLCRAFSQNPVFSKDAGIDSTLKLIDIEDSRTRPLTRPGIPPGGHNQPKWLSDGRNVVFSTISQDSSLTPGSMTRSSRPWVVDSQTGQLHAIELADHYAEFPTFAPDRRTLYFLGGGQDRPGLWRVYIGRNWRAELPEAVMPAGGATPRDLAFSADGTRVAFSQELGERTIWTLPLSAAGSSAGEAKPLIRDRSLNRDPVFSADGTKIAYSSVGVGGDSMIWVANADGSSAAPLTPADQKSARPSWSGSELAVGYQVFRNGEWSYWISPLQGRPRRLNLRLDLRVSDRLRISPDGTKIVAHTTTPHGLQVVVEDLKSGVIRNLTPPDRNVGFPFWSRDGRWIGAEERISGETSLVVVPAAGGPAQTLPADQPFASDWAPDGDRIVYSSRPGNGGTWNIFCVSRSTGLVQQLTDFQPFPGRVLTPAWSPTNNQIVFQRDDLLANIYVAELR